MRTLWIIPTICFSVILFSFETSLARKPVQSSFEATSKITLPRPHSLESDNLKGPVKTVLLEIAPHVYKPWEWTEGPRRSEGTSTYDENGNMTESVYFADQDKPSFKRSVAFDSSGKETEHILYEYEGEKISQFREVVSYTTIEGKGTRIASEKYTSHGLLYYKIVSTFDMMGMETGRIMTDVLTGLESRYTYTYNYDSTGQLREEVEETCSDCDKKDALVFKDTSSFDERGNLIIVKSQILFPGIEWGPRMRFSIVTYFYKAFDSHGNWTKRIKREEDEEVQTEYRTITYHEGEPHHEGTHSP